MSIFSHNVELDSPLRLTPWRKIAIGTWRTVGDPSVYGILELDVTPALNYLNSIKKDSGPKITFTHFVGKAVAETLARHPDINCILRFGRLYPRKSVDVFYQIASDSKGKDLSGSTVRQANTKSVSQIATEMAEKITTIREKGDPAFKKTKSIMGMLPGLLVQPMMDLVGFIMYGLNIWSSVLGSPKDPFGSVMITNIGSLGLDLAFAPLVPYSRVPLLIAVGTIRETPVVHEGQIKVAQMCRLCVTFDHRLVDGIHASHMVKTLKAIFAQPEKELA